MKKVQGGFTLIELVMVIVILGILAAVALPKFVDLKSEATTAAVKGVAGALSSASAINLAGCTVKSNAATPDKCIPLKTTDTCKKIGSELMTPAITIVVGLPVAPAATVAGTYYIVDDAVLTTTGTTCTLVLGDGSANGVTSTYTGFATGT